MVIFSLPYPPPPEALHQTQAMDRPNPTETRTLPEYAWLKMYPPPLGQDYSVEVILTEGALEKLRSKPDDRMVVVAVFKEPTRIVNGRLIFRIEEDKVVFVEPCVGMDKGVPVYGALKQPQTQMKIQLAMEEDELMRMSADSVRN